VDLSVVKQLESLVERLQAPGFAFQHDDFFALREGLPELLGAFRHSASQQSVQADANKCICVGELRGLDTCPVCGGIHKVRTA